MNRNLNLTKKHEIKPQIDEVTRTGISPDMDGWRRWNDDSVIAAIRLMIHSARLRSFPLFFSFFFLFLESQLGDQPAQCSRRSMGKLHDLIPQYALFSTFFVDKSNGVIRIGILHASLYARNTSLSLVNQSFLEALTIFSRMNLISLFEWPFICGWYVVETRRSLSCPPSQNPGSQFHHKTQTHPIYIKSY